MIKLIIIFIVVEVIFFWLGWNTKGIIELEKQIKKSKKLLSKPTGYFNLFKDKGKKWRFNILASNFKVIAVSEGYNSKRNAIGGIKSLLNSCEGFIRFRERK